MSAFGELDICEDDLSGRSINRAHSDDLIVSQEGDFCVCATGIEERHITGDRESEETSCARAIRCAEGLPLDETRDLTYAPLDLNLDRYCDAPSLVTTDISSARLKAVRTRRERKRDIGACPNNRREERVGRPSELRLPAEELELCPRWDPLAEDDADLDAASASCALVLFQ